MSKYKVDVTGLDTSSLNVLTSNEMIKLFEKYQSGDLYARDLLIEGNYRLVCEIQDDVVKILLLDVGHIKDIYK